MQQAVAYYRVSTDRQGKSGLGLEAQQTAVKGYGAAHGIHLAQEFTEIESGRKNNRSVLHDALTYCRKYKARLIIAKLDRLGRNVAFISALMESGVSFVAVDNPQANELILHIMAAFAQHERSAISTRTKEALQVAKCRGVQLGQYGKNVLSRENQEAATSFAQDMGPIIANLNKDGFKTLRAIRDELNRRNVPTYRNSGQIWHFSSVRNVMQRLKQMSNEV